MRISRYFTFVLFLVLMFVLSACGSNEAQTNSESENPTKEDTRVVEDGFGEVTIPTNPQRVAAIYMEDYLTALDVKPVVQWYHPSWGKQDYLGLDVPEFDVTGSMETLLQAKPDLIIVDGAADKAKYEEYSKIAPTYRLKEEILQDPREIVKTIADVLNIPEKANEIVDKYEERVTNLKAKLDESVGDETVAVVRLNVADKTLALFGMKNRYTGYIYTEAGLTPHPLARDMTEFQEVLSEEAIPELDADHIILFPSNGTWETEENQEAIKWLDSTLWKAVPAVKNGQVYIADRTYWQSGAITANLRKYDDLEKWFVK
ncbi:ABC transporter substrate-binding protein [Lysinibacillus sp. FSL M8-0216]|uniref:ABC-type Fe3+-hydroxamate transport system, substrate-binding protein n=1 Tax=Lysinibacillus fusiformis TaxID=28031 RepID=A0A1H9F881_9BACI|nr:ABC transporter substrate-binding protein [Lysinibacillus fusiformis]NOG29702.1 ABC transporter substrate-binding protein [Lysinibacillus fusiformis]SCX51032.1 ABC-type Fe3+-hydroxamate transport system, substrate-binding protein [Lysinibacillus fusiformis]SCY22983.1 ABC-type Fe3+-hydroxamate transport system, substrate-binding protein [Lysinibacillus fusiformis]SDB23212.1 ABC-type Fe3+-hydroxamate transport system, substrate-binding protein [Lysinibacillus fusiformis]SEN41411.1 ABC-type Fe